MKWNSNYKAWRKQNAQMQTKPLISCENYRNINNTKEKQNA